MIKRHTWWNTEICGKKELNPTSKKKLQWSVTNLRGRDSSVVLDPKAKIILFL